MMVGDQLGRGEEKEFTCGEFGMGVLSAGERDREGEGGEDNI